MGAAAAKPTRHNPDKKRALFEASAVNALRTAVSADDGLLFSWFMALPSM
jgi:hypothetical protein